MESKHITESTRPFRGTNSFSPLCFCALVARARFDAGGIVPDKMLVRGRRIAMEIHS